MLRDNIFAYPFRFGGSRDLGRRFLPVSDTARKKEANPNSIYLSKGVQNENCIEQSEYMRVRQYIHAVCEKFADFDPYGQLPNDAEILKSVKCAKNIKYSVSQTALDQKCAPTLYENIYHVRCNLFHGSKNMRSDRDKKLISESCVLLKYLLSSFLIDNSSD